MNSFTFILRSLAYHWRSHLGAGLAAAAGTAVLVGALLVGDSVRYSLHAMGTERLGSVEYALSGGDRFFKADLATRFNAEVQKENEHEFYDYRAESVLQLSGTCANDENNEQANQVQVFGIGDGFWKLGTHGPAEMLKPGEIVLNEKLAAVIGAHPGSVVRIRFYKPGLLPRDATMGSDADNSVLIRAKVKEVLPNRGFGRFSLQSNQLVPFNAFLPTGDLQAKVGQKDRANLLLLSSSYYSVQAQEKLRNPSDVVLNAVWSVDDAQLRIRTEEKLGFVEVSTPRVFLDDAFAAKLTAQGGAGVITYFVNAIRCNGREVPYSMACAGTAPLVDGALKDDEIELNDWTAAGLGAAPGATVELEYFYAGLGRKLETRRKSFKLKSIVPLAGLQADPKLMPDFPGIADVDTTHDWNSGIPIDLKKIRDKDEQYWKQHRGTPKAFITLAAGVEMWKNRFGTYTAVRFPYKEAADPARVADAVKGAATPGAFGMTLLPVRAMADAASQNAVDFGGLFLGLSFFLIAAAALLIYLMFQFSVESRARETGVLLALGWPGRLVRRSYWFEGVLLSALGSALGIGAGTFYARAVLEQLATHWRGAVGTAALEYHAEPRSFVIGYAAGIIVAALAVFFAVRRQTELSARELLSSSAGVAPAADAKTSRLWTWTGAISLLCALASALAAHFGAMEGAEGFFTAGGLLLIGSLCLVRVLAIGRATESATRPSLTALGMRSTSRRPGRSLATVALLSCGAFLVIAVGANQQDSAAHAAEKTSGTGGFALYAQSTVPVFEDLNTEKGRSNAGLDAKGLDGVTIYQFRVHAGDEASCLNLNRAQQPRILGVPDSFIKRGGFTFVAGESDFRALDSSPFDPSHIPAICDYQSLTWALGMKVGDELSVTDEHGKDAKVKFASAVANSILQGSVLISEDNFLKLYPSASGYQVFLVDAPAVKVADVSKTLRLALRDEGLDVTSAAARLAEFNAVENTYLATFEALGALGMLLGSIGLGVVVLRNVLERRGELALLRALGFSGWQAGWLVLSEHIWLLILGLLAGMVSSLLAVAPAMKDAGGSAAWTQIGALTGAILICGLFSAIAAAWISLRAPLVAALRND